MKYSFPRPQRAPSASSSARPPWPRRLSIVFAWVACSVSASAAIWTNRPVPAISTGPTLQITDLVYTNGRFVVNADGRLYHSTDGSNWLSGPHAEPTRRDLRTLNGMFYYALGNDVFQSDNGIYWNRFMTMPAANPPPSSEVVSVDTPKWATDGQGAVVVRSQTVTGHQMIYSQVDLYRTTDRQTWQPAGPLPGTTPQSSVTVQGFVGANGRYLINYFASEVPASNVPSVSITACSEDGGATWQRANMQGEHTALRLLYGNGWYLAVSDTGGIYRSTDGLYFGRIANNLPAGYDANIKFAGGMFIVRTTGPNNTLYGSVDLYNWHEIGQIPYTRINGLSAVAYGAGRFYAVGNASLYNGQVNGPFLMSTDQPSAPVILRQPGAAKVAQSRKLRIGVDLETPDPTATYRWMKDGVLVPGATSAKFTIEQVSPIDAGHYRCLITNAQGTVASDEARVTVYNSELAGRLSNLSVNSVNGAGAQQINVGFAVQGNHVKPVLIRGIGPTLAQFGITDFMADPRLSLIQSGTVRKTNDNWTLFDGSDVGGFPLPVGSLDAVIPTNLNSGAYSVIIDSSANATGRVLTEIYDNNLNDGETRLSNLSARANVPTGGSLVVGFVIEGTTPLSVIIRGVGPTLAQFGIANPLTSPVLSVFDKNGTPLVSRTNWWGDDGRDLGAFPLPANSGDAVIQVTLNSGIYTAAVTSWGPTDPAGIALLEVYDAN